MRPNSLEFRAHLYAGARFSAENGIEGLPDGGDIVFFRVPLDSAALSEFRSHDPAESVGNGNGAASEIFGNGNSWQAFYSFRNDDLGIEWQLRLRDLTRKSEWERWSVLESHAVPLATRE